MKHRIWIFLLLAVCAGLICFGAYKLSTAKDKEADKADKTSVSKTEFQPMPSKHIEGLDRVKSLPAIESMEYDYEGFRLSFNKHNRTPNWVAWELLGTETSGEHSRHNKFWQDERVEGCATTDDYRNSGYDRGHLCPAADQKWSRKAMDDCFVMANMCPQVHALNSGAWNTLENRERDWAKRDSALVIVAGPIYSPEDKTTIGNGVLVPGAFFKVILAPYVEKPRAIAFVYPNMSAPGNMQNYVTTVDEVEKLAGLDFFYMLHDEIENEVESKSSFREWNKR